MKVKYGSELHPAWVRGADGFADEAASYPWGKTTEIDGGDNAVPIRQSFGIYDRKGREIGATAWVGTVTFEAFTPTEEKYQSYSSIKPGTYYTYRPVATRGGNSYGASSSTEYFTTAASRDAAVEKYFVGARKRAAKNAGK